MCHFFELTIKSIDSRETCNYTICCNGKSLFFIKSSLALSIRYMATKSEKLVLVSECNVCDKYFILYPNFAAIFFKDISSLKFFEI